nr:MAG TPA: hypothetical protein [Caudoviricetes sp.]
MLITALMPVSVIVIRIIQSVIRILITAHLKFLFVLT